MKILITGGAGYIGSHVVNLLGLAKHEITIVDNLSTGRKESILYGSLVQINIENYCELEALIKSQKFDACINFAGSIVVPESINDPIKYYKNNTQNSLELIRLCKENQINKFIFSSTAAVYGDPSNGRCSEETTLAPINPYGRSKLMTEWMLEDVAKSSDLSYVALRYFNVAGANVNGLIGQCTPNATHLIKIACECATEKRNGMSIFGNDYNTPDGTCIRDYIHVDDLAQAHVDALNYLNQSKKSQILNCGYGHGSSVQEVINVVKKVTHSDFEVKIAPKRKGDSPELISVANKIKTVLNWKPKYDNLELIIKTAYEWEKYLK